LHQSDFVFFFANLNFRVILATNWWRFLVARHPFDLDWTRIQIVAEAESDDDEQNVQDEHHNTHSLSHLPTKNIKQLITSLT
jgi:hypothetical protein